jgi:hypothetical protein
MKASINSDKFPKTIWFLWLQGLEQAPLVVSKCYESWLLQNKGWEIVLLDHTNLRDYMNLSVVPCTDQALSDVVRINLLAKYGGIWVDATCFCNKPLDSWIYNYMAQGFFAFERPGPDRMISSWFIASFKNSYITETLNTVVNAYWRANPKLVFYENSRWRWLVKYPPKDSQRWFNFFYTKGLKIHPYFWFHFLFERIYLENEKVRELWDATSKISADIPHVLQNAGLLEPLSNELKNEIDGRSAPLYKLSWKYNPSEVQPNSALNYLFYSQNNNKC